MRQCLYFCYCEAACPGEETIKQGTKNTNSLEKNRIIETAYFIWCKQYAFVLQKVSQFFRDLFADHLKQLFREFLVFENCICGSMPPLLTYFTHQLFTFFALRTSRHQITFRGGYCSCSPDFPIFRCKSSTPSC